MRVLIINSMFANRLYRRAADELGALPNVDLTMLTVDAWRMNDRPMPFDELEVGSPYATVVGNAGWRGYENRGFYRTGIIRAFRQSKPEVIFLMEEPFSIFALQIVIARALFAPASPIVFFTWNNLSLTKFDYRPGVFYRWAAKLTVPQLASALTANDAGHDVLRDVGFRGPIKTVGYGVDSDVYSKPRAEAATAVRAKLNIRSTATVIGYVGRLIEKKAIDVLIRAFAELKKQYPDKELILLLVGSGEEERALLELADSLGINESLRHMPSVAHDAVPDVMHALDILVLPSRRRAMWAEQFGRVLVEAMAAGKIVIGSSSGAIPEVIGDAGFVFKEDDTEGLIAQLGRAITFSADEREALRTKAIQRATQHYSWKRFAQDAKQAIEEAFKLRKAGA